MSKEAARAARGTMQQAGGPAGGTVLEAVGLVKCYRSGTKEVRAVDGVNVRLERGMFLAITGPSGAGKSTLLHLLGALDTPTQGRVVLDGADISALGEAGRARIRNERIGFVFQFYHLLGEFTALENVLFPALMCGAGQRRRAGMRDPNERARRLLERVGLGHRLDHRPDELSGGECQRVAVARALMNEPDILLCDEPTGNLDSKAGREVVEILIGARRETPTALVIATHDESLRERADSVVRIKDGKVA